MLHFAGKNSAWDGLVKLRPITTVAVGRKTTTMSTYANPLDYYQGVADRISLGKREVRIHVVLL